MCGSSSSATTAARLSSTLSRSRPRSCWRSPWCRATCRSPGERTLSTSVGVGSGLARAPAAAALCSPARGTGATSLQAAERPFGRHRHVFLLAACRRRVTTSCTFPSSSLASSAPPTWPSPSRSRSSRPPTSPPRPSRRCCSSGWEAGSCGRPAKSWRLAATQSRGGLACTTVSLPTGATTSTASMPRRSSFRLQRSSRSCQPATARTRQPRRCARWPSSCSGFASSACCSSRQRSVRMS